MKNPVEVVVEQNNPIPNTKRGKPTKYNWHALDVGHNIFIKSDDEYVITSARTAAKSYGVRHNMKFTSRKVAGGLRIWRIE